MTETATIDEQDTDTTEPGEEDRKYAGPWKGRGEDLDIEVGQILADRNHRRARPGDEGRQAALAESLNRNGMLQPVGLAELVEGMTGYSAKGGTRYRLLFGARRLAAAVTLGWTDVPARVFPVTSDAEVESLRAIENLHRQNITAVEEAQAVSDVIAFYLEEHPPCNRADAIRFCAQHTGQTEEWVRARDYFDRLTPRVRAAALEASVPATHLRELATVGSEADQWSLMMQVLGVSAWQARELASIDPEACKDKWVRGQLEDLRDAIDGGAVRYMPIRELRKAVAESRRKLRGVKWDLSLVVLSGKEELPPCVDCPKNSATEPGLFGLDATPAVKDATCGDATCYKAKGEAAEKARAALLKSFAKKKEVPTPDEVKAKLDNKSVWPGGLDIKKAVGFVQREVKKRVSPASETEGKKSGGGSSYGQRKLTKHEVALLTFRNAYTDWLGQTAGAIWAAALGQPPKMAALLIFQRLRIFDDWRARQALLMETPTSSTYGKEETGVPKPAEALPKEVDMAVRAVELGGVDAVLALAALECDLVECVVLEEVLHVEVAARLAAAVGAELPMKPRWEDFAPSAKEAPTKNKPARKKVGKKKTTKKKKAAGQ